MEMTAAIIGTLLLLLGALKLTIWLGERMTLRQISYEQTRKEASSDASPGVWQDPTIQANRSLRFFVE